MNSWSSYGQELIESPLPLPHMQSCPQLFSFDSESSKFIGPWFCFSKDYILGARQAQYDQVPSTCWPGIHPWVPGANPLHHSRWPLTYLIHLATVTWDSLWFPKQPRWHSCTCECVASWTESSGLVTSVWASSKHHQLSWVLFYLHGHIHLLNLSLPMYSLWPLKDMSTLLAELQ